jgi:hypothetical protein
MAKIWLSGAERLANTARAAGYAMATPDDHADTPIKAEPQPAQPATSAWTTALPQSRAVVVTAPRAVKPHWTLREWMAALTWRAPA